MFEFFSTVIVKALKSRTLIAAWLLFLVGLGQYITGAEVIQQYPQVTAAVASIVGMLQMVLRYVTTSSLSEK